METQAKPPICNGVKGKIETFKEYYKVETTSFLHVEKASDSNVEFTTSPNIDWMETDEEKRKFAESYVGKGYLYVTFWITQDMYILIGGQKRKVNIPSRQDDIIYIFSNPEKCFKSAKEPILLTYEEFSKRVDVAKWSAGIKVCFDKNKDGLALLHHDYGCIVSAKEFVYL